MIFGVTLINLFCPSQTIKKEGVANLFYLIMWFFFSQQKKVKKLYCSFVPTPIAFWYFSELLNLLLLTLIMTILFVLLQK